MYPLFLVCVFVVAQNNLEHSQTEKIYTVKISPKLFNQLAEGEELESMSVAQLEAWRVKVRPHCDRLTQYKHRADHMANSFVHD